MIFIAYYVSMFVVGRIYKEISFKPVALVVLGAVFATGLTNYLDADVAAQSEYSHLLLYFMSFVSNLVVASILFALGFSRDEL
jgi:hypothetical protein